MHMHTTSLKPTVADSRSRYPSGRRTSLNSVTVPATVLRLLSSLFVLPGLLLLSTSGHAEFALNFSGPTSTTVVHGGSTLFGQSPFTPMGSNKATGESFVDPVNGLRYWHYILGNPATGFAQEVFIQSTGVTSCGQSTICSASGGTVAFGNTINVLAANNTSNSGNGTGNPNRVLVRQVLGGTWSEGVWSCNTAFCSEFIKSAYDRKPKITQGINGPDYSATFIVDMSAIALNNNTTALTITSGTTGATGSSLTNVQSVTDAATGSVMKFDMAVNSQATNVNGGKYIYTAGTGVLGAGGTYTYVDGGYNPTAVNYSPFLDHTVSNPWAWPGARP